MMTPFTVTESRHGPLSVLSESDYSTWTQLSGGLTFTPSAPPSHDAQLALAPCSPLYP